MFVSRRVRGLTRKYVAYNHRKQNVTTITRKENRRTRGAGELTNRGELLRDYLRRCLYDKSKGYFNQNGQSPIGKIGGESGEALLFHLMADKDEYTEILAQKWTQLGKQWLTPVEIFKPHYANAIARYLIEEKKKQSAMTSLKVIELGGGAGTAAVGILNYIRENETEMYKSMKYLSIDVSEISLLMQQDAISEHGHEAVWCRTNNPVDVTMQKCKSTEESWREITQKHMNGSTEGCFVLGFEILDNLVHDKVIMSVKTGNWMQARVKHEQEGKDRAEFYEPITDEEIKRVLDKVIEIRKSLPFWTHLSDAVKRMIKKREVNSTADLTRNQTIYLPTGCSFALQNLREFIPGHRLVLADFDTLPDAKMDGLNSPVIASQGVGGKTYDRNSYLEGVVGSSDIFFPTCFDTLKLLDENKGTHITTKEFMKKYSEQGACETKSGYNPLHNDYSNTRFYLS